MLNCHTHTFTIRHVPDDYLPGVLTAALRNPTLRAATIWTLDHVDPWGHRDLAKRYAAFLGIDGESTQEEVFRKLAARYPEGTRFIVLPMDMTYMDAGKVPADINSQHRELADMALDDPRVIPFYAIDPRHPGFDWKRFDALYWDDTFKGIKLYPNLGYAPTDPRLLPMYATAEERGLPIMAHCSRGGVYNKKLGQKAAGALADPTGWLPVLEKHPNLRLCLAHWGGDEEWNAYVAARNAGKAAPTGNWVEKIRAMLASGRYPNLYTDLSYTIFAVDQRISAIKELLADARVRSRVLFGSDFYMATVEPMREVDVLARFRAALPAEWWSQLTEANPEGYLATVDNRMTANHHS